MAESKIRVKHARAFTTVYNSVIRDGNLSLKTLGMFVIMQSFPEDWEYSISGLAARCRIGRDAVRKCLKELEDAGYLLREQGHQENGKFACNTYVLQSEAPPCTEKPYTVKPSTEKPLTENRTQEKKHLSKETSSNPPIVPNGGKGVRKRKVPRDAPDWKPERFAGFWKYYPKKGRRNRQAAMDAWDKLQPDDSLIDVIAKALVKLKDTDEWKRDVGIPYAARFLNESRWRDAEELDASDARPPARKEVYGWL